MPRRMASPRFSWLLVGFGLSLLLAGAQLLIFVPMLESGHALDVPPFRVDALSVAIGVTFTLALGLGLPFARLAGGGTARLASLYLLFLVGVLALTYAREPLLFVAGWEVAGFALWQALRESAWGGNTLRCALAIHTPGLLLLGALALGPGEPFAPPQGGAATMWSLFVVASFAIVALFRACCWPFLGPPIPCASASTIVSLYILISPVLLAKALVAAPWDALGVWLLALAGTVALLGCLLAPFYSPGSKITAVAACSAACVVGMGLAPASPLAAAGALALLLATVLWIITPLWLIRAALLFLSGLTSIWLLSQGALDARYKLVATLLLPSILVLAYMTARRAGHDQEQLSPFSVAAFFLLLPAALYPQAVVEWVLRPAVGAMAGGVGVPSALLTNWGLGLKMQSPSEVVLASMPSAGIVLAVFLAWVALYWLRGLARWANRTERQEATNSNVTGNESGETG